MHLFLIGCGDTVSVDHLRTMAMRKVMEATVFTMEVTNVGDVYLRLAKYMFRVKLTLQFSSTHTNREQMLCSN